MNLSCHKAKHRLRRRLPSLLEWAVVIGVFAPLMAHLLTTWYHITAWYYLTLR